MTPMNVPAKSRRVLLAVVGVVVLVAAGAAIWFGLSDRAHGRTPQEEDAVSECRDHAKDYPGLTDGRLEAFEADTVTHDGELYRVLGTASAKDGFGGTNRYAFVCELKDQGKWWELLDLSMT